jgi:hypothetical protein
MSNEKSTLIIKNENLFRTLVFSPVAILLIIFGGEFLASSGLFFFKIIYVLVGLYSSLCALAYGAYYTNDLYEGGEESFIKNDNLFKAIVFTPLAVLFTFFAFDSIAGSSHIVFNVMYILIAMYFILGALAYAAFYSNDYYAEKYHEA